MPSEPYRTVGATYSRDRLKVRTIVIPYIVAGPTENEGADPWETIDSFQPEAPLGLVEVGRTAPQEDNGDFKLSITFEGVVGDGALGALLEYDNSSVESPIETFEKFDLLDAKYGPAIYADPKKSQFQGWPKKLTKNDGTGDEGEKNPLFGATHFLEGNTILLVTFITKDFKPELLRNLNKIQQPQVPAGLEQNIQTAEGKTWLYKTFKAKFRGNCWENQLEYWEGKWTPDIYNPTN